MIIFASNPHRRVRDPRLLRNTLPVAARDTLSEDTACFRCTRQGPVSSFASASAAESKPTQTAPREVEHTSPLADSVASHEACAMPALNRHHPQTGHLF